MLPPASARSGPPLSARSCRSDGSASTIRGRGFDKLHPTWSQAVVAAAADVAAAAAQADSRSTDCSDHVDKFELRMVDKRWSRVSDPFDAPPPPEYIRMFAPMREDIKDMEDDIPVETPLTHLALHQIEYGFEADFSLNSCHGTDDRDDIPAEAPVIRPGAEREQLPLVFSMMPLPVQPWLEPENGLHDPASHLGGLSPHVDFSHGGNVYEPPSRNEGMNDVAKVWQHLPPLPMVQEDTFVQEHASPITQASTVLARDGTPIARENVVLQDTTFQQDEQFKEMHVGDTDAAYPTRIGQQGVLHQSGAWEAAIGDGPRLVPPDSPCKSPRSPRSPPRSPRHEAYAESVSPSGISPRGLRKIEPEASERTCLSGTSLAEARLSLDRHVHLCNDRIRGAGVQVHRDGQPFDKNGRARIMASMSAESLPESPLPSPSRSTNLQLLAHVKQEAKELLFMDIWPRCSGLCFPMWVPLMSLVLTLVFLCGLASLLWYGETPVMVQGAFNLITQIDAEASLKFHFISKAQKDARSTLGGLHATRVDEDGAEYMWRHVEVVFQMHGADLLDLDSLRMVWRAEEELRELPGWHKLCLQEVPVAHRHLCDPGDSFVAVAYGSKSKADDAAAAIGVLKEVVFDGHGSTLLMPVDSFLTFVKHLSGDAYKRWLAQTDEDGSHLRTMFSFYLPKEDGGMWDNFVRDELEPKLAEQAERGDGPCGDAPETSDTKVKSLRMFYRATGLHSNELMSAVQGDIQKSIVVASLGAFLPTFLATRRMLLGITALLLAVAAPTISSSLAATRGDQGKLEYPAIAIAPWLLIAITCTDLAVACTNTWALKSWSSKKGCQLAPCFFLGKFFAPMRRLSRFLVEVPMPTCVPVVMFLGLQGAMVDVPLITEFATHMGYALLTAVLFSTIIYPPAIELGDFLHGKLKQIRSLRRVRRRCRNLMPWELGGKLARPDVVLGISRKFTKMLGSKIALCLVLITSAVMIIVISLNSYSPRYHLTIPDLFEESHRLSKGPKIWALFGEEQLMGKFTAPSKTLQNARTCTPDAWESAGCSWHKCEVDPTERLQDDRCVCFANTPGAASGCTGAMPAAARFVGLDSSSDFHSKAQFWTYAQEALQLPIVNGSVYSWEIGPVVMENWQTGRVTAAPQISSRINRADGSTTSWEDACFRALCYCNLRPCLLSSAWTFLGRFPVDSVGDGGRRMAVQGGSSSTSTVFVVWGIAPPTFRPTKVPPKSEALDYIFTPFNARSPWVQRNILGLCESTRPSLQVFARQCWAIDFKWWLYERGERFPVRSDRFDALFMEFVVAAEGKSTELSSGILPPGAERESSYKYFWFDDHGLLRGCFATFNVHTPPAEDVKAARKYINEWDSYMFMRNVFFNNVVLAWYACPLAASVEELMVLKKAAGWTLAWAFSSAALLVLAMTFSFALSLATVIVLALSLGCFAALGVYFGEDVGILELLGFGTFMMILTTPMTRTMLQYALASSRIYDDTEIKEFGSEDPDLLTLMSRLRRGKTSASTLGNGLAPTSSETYLVDNRGLKAPTLGIGYRLSPRIADLDREADFEDSLAKWGSKVIGTQFGDDWLKVDNRFLPMFLHGVSVLTLVEETSEDEFSSVPTDHAPFFSRASFVLRADEIIKYVTGLTPDVQLWPGAPRAERMDRLSAALASTFTSAFASSLASAIVGVGLLVLRMKAFEVLGFAALCASAAAPIAALGFMSVLTIWGFGPTDAYRKAFLDYMRWMMHKHRDRQRRGKSGDEELVGMIQSISLGITKQTTENYRAAGESAARVLGFPFSLSVKTVSEHIRDIWTSRSGGRTETATTTQTTADAEQAPPVLDDAMHAVANRNKADIHTATVVSEKHLVDDRSSRKREPEKRGLDHEVRDLLAAARNPASGIRAAHQPPQHTCIPVQDVDTPDLSSLFQTHPYHEPAHGNKPPGRLISQNHWHAHQVPEQSAAQRDEEVRELLAAARSPALRQRPPPLDIC